MSRRVLVNQLSGARLGFCGLGTRGAKIKLNKLGKTDPIARALRLALEIEDCSTQGKKYFGSWSDTYYRKKSEFIHELIELFRAELWTFGKQPSLTRPRWIIYFEIPDCEQISFHTELLTEVPDYTKAWDGKRNSTFGKLEAAVVRLLDNGRNLIE